MLPLLLQIALAQNLPLRNADYTTQSTPWGAIDLTVAGTPLSTVTDDGSEAVALPFSFPFMDATYNTAYVNYNGGISFDPRDIAFNNESLYTSTTEAPDIACWWDDLYALSAIRWWHDAANDRVIFAWNDTTHFGYATDLRISFQTMLYRDGTIECHYTDAAFGDAEVDYGISATIGIVDVTDGVESSAEMEMLSFHETPAWLTDHSAIRFERCADDDGDGFACFDCDDTLPHAGDADGDLRPDACDACPADPVAFDFDTTSSTDCDPDFGEITLFTGVGWTGSCVTFSAGVWTLAQMTAAGIANDAAASALVGPGTWVVLSEHDGFGGRELTLTDDADDVSYIGVSTFVIRAEVEEIDPDLDGCPTLPAGCTDADADGFCAESWDCDDADPDVHPTATEACDGTDRDCDGLIGELPDVDGDNICDVDDATWGGWTSTTLSSNTGEGTDVALADADLDGDLDVFATYNTRRVMNTHRNDGTGSFTATSNLSVSSAKLFALATGDVDGDGDPDALVSGESPTTLSWARNTAGALVGTQSVAAVTERAGAVALADLDGDADLDAVATFYSAGTVQTWRNDGSGAFSAYTSHALIGASMLAVADLDGDGLPEIFCAAANGTLQILFNDGSTFSATSLGAAGSTVFALLTEDIDADGDADLLVGSRAGLLVWQNLGARTFASAETASSIIANELASGDLDDDGDLDLVASVSASATVRVLLNDGAGGFPTVTTLFDLPGSYADDVAVGDLDNDGDLDVAVQSPSDDNALLVFTNPMYLDADHDGWLASADCDDADPTVQPGGVEVCDGVDNSCDGRIDEGAADLDADAICDDLDACPLDPFNDSDADGSCDSADACLGDDTAGDADDDATCDDLDPCPLDPFDDSDADGSCDSVDLCLGDDDAEDTDADAVCDDLDLCPLDPLNDSDADGSCDSADLCLGDDTAGDADDDATCDDLDPCPLDPFDDSDADGTCDSADLCLGDDTTGDTDGDATCDAADFLLSASPLTGGGTLTLSAVRAEPGARVYFLLGTSGVGSGPCFPGSTVCTDLRSPTALGSDVADAQGRARLSITVPSTVPAGRTVRFQAAWIDRAGGVITGDTTQVLAATSQ